jgi:hypothetical protein
MVGMPFQKGHPKLGGRVKGSRNKSAVQRDQLLAIARTHLDLTPEEILSLDPLAVLTAYMREAVAAGDRATAIQCAIACAPYRHPRLAQTDLRVKHELGEKSDLELEAEILDLTERLRLTAA